jgi:hypothetical protein
MPPNLTRSITVYVPNLTSITAYTPKPKNIIQFRMPPNIRSITVYVYNLKNIIKFRMLPNLRSITVYNPKNIVKNTTPFAFAKPKAKDPKPKVIIELCNANEQKLKDSQGDTTQIKNNNVNNTASLSNSMLSSAFFFSNHLGRVLRCLRWVSYSDMQRNIMSGFVQLRREEVSNTSLNIIFLNSCLIFGVGLCLSVPILNFYFTGLNLYDYSSNIDSVYSSSLINIRISCAIVF